jgi:hypothetical protein
MQDPVTGFACTLKRFFWGGDLLPGRGDHSGLGFLLLLGLARDPQAKSVTGIEKIRISKKISTGKMRGQGLTFSQEGATIAAWAFSCSLVLPAIDFSSLAISATIAGIFMGIKDSYLNNGSSQGQNPAVTVVIVPDFLDGGG